jgi:hypothetical protein
LGGNSGGNFRHWIHERALPHSRAHLKSMSTSIARIAMELEAAARAALPGP